MAHTAACSGAQRSMVRPRSLSPISPGYLHRAKTTAAISPRFNLNTDSTAFSIGRDFRQGFWRWNLRHGSQLGPLGSRHPMESGFAWGK